MYVCRARVAARVRTLSFSFFSFLRRSSSLEEELELLSLSLELEPGIRPGLRTSAVWRAASLERRVGDVRYCSYLISTDVLISKRLGSSGIRLCSYPCRKGGHINWSGSQ